MELTDTPLYMTHHSPVGGFCSLTFGLPGHGASIDLESPQVSENADLIIGYSAAGTLRVLPFSHQAEPALNAQTEGSQEGPHSEAPAFKYIRPEAIQRRLEGGTDTYTAEHISLSVYTPSFTLPDPRREDIGALPCCPAVLLRLTADNTCGTEPMTGFLGLALRIPGRIHNIALADDTLAGFGYLNRWALAAQACDGVYALRSAALPHTLLQRTHVLHETGPGVICVDVPAGQKRTITAAFGFFHEGIATNGIATRYYYRRFLQSVPDVCRYTLDHQERFIAEADALDELLMHCVPSVGKRGIVAQSVRAYYASTQLLEAPDGSVLYNVGEGAYVWRNTMDLAPDHLPWELRRNPWVVRNIMEMYISHYSYVDQVTFDGETYHPGGLSFTHDMGNFATFSPQGRSAYERTDVHDIHCYFYMTTEELLSGLTCMLAYALYTNDLEWLHTQCDVLLRLMESLENRDHTLPHMRDGILKADSSRCGIGGRESTTYDCLDASLMRAGGSAYITVKCFCALVMLERAAALMQYAPLAQRATHMREKLEGSFARFWMEDGSYLKPNLFENSESRVIAIVEPLGMLRFLGLYDPAEHVSLHRLLQAHIHTCLQPGVCIDETNGGLRMSQNSDTSFVSKVALTLYVLETVFGVAVEQTGIMKQLLLWCRQASKEITLSEQVFVSQCRVIGGLYYPRIAVSALWCAQ